MNQEAEETVEQARDKLEQKIEERKRVSRKLKLVIGGAVLLVVLVVGLVLYLRYQSTSERVVKQRVRTLVTEVKQSAGDHTGWIALATPAVRRPIRSSVQELGVPVDEVLKHTAFPYDLLEAPVAPETDMISVDVKEGLARTYFTDDMGNSYQFYLARDEGDWWIYLQTPVEVESYGDVEERFELE